MAKGLTLITTSLFYLLLINISMNVNAQPKMQRRELLNTLIEKRTVSSVNAVEIEFPAGQKGPYHKHPCPVFGIIISGNCLLQVEGESKQILGPGDAFYEPAKTPILHFDNHSETEPLKFVAYYLMNDEKELIQMLPQPKNDQ